MNISTQPLPLCPSAVGPWPMPSISPSDTNIIKDTTTFQFFSLKAWNLDRYADFTMPDAMISQSWPMVWAILCLYLGMVFTVQPLKKHSQSNQWIPHLVDLQTTRHAWNSALALYSILGSFHMLSYLIHQLAQNGLYATLVHPDDSFYQGPVGFWFLLFVLGKMVEFGDTVFLLASGRRVIFLHWFHHATVLPCCWYALLNRIPMLAPCTTLNYCVHAVMYSYFALNDTNCADQTFKVTWAQRITTLQCTQFVLDLMAIGTGGYDRYAYGNPHIPYASVVLSAFIIASYLYLFLQFAEEKYAYKSQAKKGASNLLYRISSYFHGAQNKTSAEGQCKAPESPWHNPKLTLAQQFEQATKMAVMMYGAANEQDLLDLYGCYKQAREGPIPDEVLASASDDKDLTKAKAWLAVKELSTEQAQQKYMAIMDVLSERNHKANQSTTSSEPSTKPRTAPNNPQNSDVQFPIRIAGHGRYLPQRIVPNSEVEQMGGFELSSQESKRTGVVERHYAAIDQGESLIENGAAAIRAACDKAGIHVEDLDLIVGGFGGHQFLPDDASLVQGKLGLGTSGIRAFTVHATCLSFVVAMEVAASLMKDNNGKYRNVAVFASSISSVALWRKDPHTAGLFGDGAAAVILQPSNDAGIHGCHMETYGVGSDACAVRGCGTFRPPYHPKYEERMGYFEMNGPQTLALVSKYIRGGLYNFMPGLEKGLDNLHLPGTEDTRVDIDWVIPHQASQVALDSLAMFNWPQERILKTLHKYGNCIAASIPLTLCDAIDSGKIQRGDKVLLCGTSAGISVGSMLLTY